MLQIHKVFLYSSYQFYYLKNNNKVNLIFYSKAGNVSQGMSIICQAISDTTEDIIKLIRIPNRYVFSRSSIVCNIFGNCKTLYFVQYIKIPSQYPLKRWYTFYFGGMILPNWSIYCQDIIFGESRWYAMGSQVILMKIFFRKCNIQLSH